MSKNFKVGDAVYYEAHLGTIERMEGERVIEVRAGGAFISGNHLADYCFHVSEPVRLASEWFSNLKTRIHNLKGGVAMSLNFPEIIRYVDWMWANACDHAEKYQIKPVDDWMEEARSLFSNIVSMVETANEIKIAIPSAGKSIPLFRQ